MRHKMVLDFKTLARKVIKYFIFHLPILKYVCFGLSETHMFCCKHVDSLN